MVLSFGMSAVEEAGAISELAFTGAAPAISEVLCLGETMQLFATKPGTPLATASTVNIYAAGAESNVASGLAHLGQSVEWFSRVGSDPFGEHICEFLSGRGVDVRSVVVDETRPTGVFFKERVGGGSAVYYYRAGSAASAMSSKDVTGLALGRRRLCHLSGITAALSPECDNMLHRILFEKEGDQCPVSFDVNFRGQLWDTVAAAPRLLELARAADIVLVGRDEAEILWSTGDADSVRRLLPDVPQLIVKDDVVGATQFSEGNSTFVPALSVDVVDSVGAGDAFAAGYLSGWLDGYSVEHALRLGHLMAAFTLQDLSDVPVLPPAAEIVRLSSVDESTWNDLTPRASKELLKERKKT